MTTPEDSTQPDTTEVVVPTPTKAWDRVLLAAAQYHYWDNQYKNASEKQNTLHAFAKEELTPKGKYKKTWQERIDAQAKVVMACIDNREQAKRNFRDNGHDHEAQFQDAAVARAQSVIHALQTHFADPWRDTCSVVAVAHIPDISHKYHKRCKEANAINAERIKANPKSAADPLLYGLDPDGILPDGAWVVLDLTATLPWKVDGLYATVERWKSPLQADEPERKRIQWHLKLGFNQTGRLGYAKVYTGWEHEEPYVYKRGGTETYASADVLSDSFGTECHSSLNFAASGSVDEAGALAFAHEIVLAVEVRRRLQPLLAQHASPFHYNTPDEKGIAMIYDHGRAEAEALLKQYGERVDASASAE